MTRTFAIGDPQGPFAKFLEVLDRHRLLAGDRLADDVVLISIGDHFDYDHRDPVPAAREGLQLLRWLASHDPAQVMLVLGNHDAARVMEFAALSDDDFALARACDDATYASRFAALPPQHVLARDYASFTTEQRALVQDLLLARRFHLAIAAKLPCGHVALVSHAAVTTRELRLLGAAPTTRAIAEALEDRLARAIDDVSTAWRRGERAALSLEPLHRTGGGGREGGGLLYHRPSNPESGSPFDPDRPRRFDPRTLPAGVVQVAGHTGHNKCLHELGDWCTLRAHERKHGGLRTLHVTATAEVSYDLGVAAFGARALEREAALILIDSELRRVAAEEVELLALECVEV